MTNINYSNIILSVIGPDKPGIVSNISKIIKKNSGNIEVSRMVKLGNFFTIMVLVTIKNDQIDVLKNNLINLQDYQVSVNQLKNIQKNIKQNTHTIYLDGIDNEGLVYKITNQLAELNINIEELETNVKNAPMSGATLFSLKAIISHPNLDYNMLNEKMDKLAAKLDVNIIVEN